MRPRTRDEFETAIICALPLEADAVEALFDETYDKLSRIYGKQAGDANAYTTGRIGQHNVVLCYMPGMGKGSAASVASSLRTSYRRIRLVLVVGICGGVPFPSRNTEIILGDVIISDSVIGYDFGRQYPNGFQRKCDVKEALGRPNREIRTLLAGLKTRKTLSEFQERISQHLQRLQEHAGTGWHYPGVVHDVLFEASYRHRHYQRDPVAKCLCTDCKSGSDPVCDEALKKDCYSLGCMGMPVHRRRFGAETFKPLAHIGTIASADTVMKSGEHRDKLAEKEGVIAFEMEGAGVWDNLPCVIIKGVCDYADSHKNKIWQDYAAATAASGTKAFLEYWIPTAREAISFDGNCCLTDPSSSSQGRIKQMLKTFIDEVRAGKRGSVVSIQSTGSLSADEKEAWRQLRKELENIGITPAFFTEHSALIVDTLQMMVSLLLQHGADIGGKEKSGETVLHYAAEHTHRAMMNLLLKKRADKTVENNSGETALQLVARREREEEEKRAEEEEWLKREEERLREEEELEYLRSIGWETAGLGEG